MSQRALIVCPGRGSYGRASLGQLRDRGDAARRVIEACDSWRSQVGRDGVTELDADTQFRASRHVAGEHASLLTFACSLADLADLDRERFEPVAITGNSMGWYTALAASGALSLSEAIRLVDTMGAYQIDNVIGGQLLYPTTDESWEPDAGLEAAITRSLAACTGAGQVAEWSIRLGGFAVLGADSAGLKTLKATLPPIERGTRTFPLKLPLHSAFHTSLMQGTSERATVDLGDLAMGSPALPLVDGRGIVHRPLSADPLDLLEYTLGAQVTQTYDLSTAVRAALRYSGAEVVIALGPGNGLGGPLARILAAEGWRGATGKAGLAAIQDTDRPLLRSFGLPPQRRMLV